MQRLTDEQIVLRIAKAMGWRDDGGMVLRSPNSDGFLNWTEFRYLTSYDAIADVWRKLLNGNPNVYCECENCALCHAHDGLPDGYWFMSSPREHAEAIALALGGEE